MSATESEPRVVRVGVALFLFEHGEVKNRDNRGKFVLMLRRGSHGAGTWGLPGGHIEYGESVFDAARREAREELDVDVDARDIEQLGWSEAVFTEEGRHYVTVLCRATLRGGQLPRVAEPDKCTGLRWCSRYDMPEPLFLPLRNFIGMHGVPEFDR